MSVAWLCCDVICVGMCVCTFFQLQRRIDRINRKRTQHSVTFIKVGIILGVLGEGEAVGDLQPVLDNQAQQDALNHLAALALFLVVLDNLQHHLWKQEEQHRWSIKALRQNGGRDGEKGCFTILSITGSEEWFHVLNRGQCIYPACCLCILWLLKHFLLLYFIILWFMLSNSIVSPLVKLICSH